MEGIFCKENQTNALCKEVSRSWVEAVRNMPSIASDENHQDYRERAIATFDPPLRSQICLMNEVKKASFQLLKSRNQLDNDSIETLCRIMEVNRTMSPVLWGIFMGGLFDQKGCNLPEEDLNMLKQNSNTLRIWQAAENFYQEVQDLDKTSTDDKPVDDKPDRSNQS